MDGFVEAYGAVFGQKGNIVTVVVELTEAVHGLEL